MHFSLIFLIIKANIYLILRLKRGKKLIVEHLQFLNWPKTNVFQMLESMEGHF